MTAPRLLLIEDNLDYAYLVERMLRDSWGDAAPDHVARLDDALGLLHEREYDCVVLDLGLPDASGVDVLSAVHEAAPGVPVVVLTAFGDEDDSQDALRLGAQDYLLKERVKAPELRQAIRYAIERGAAADAVRRSGERLELLLAGISDVIVVLGPDGTVPYVSPSVKRVLGYDPESITSSVGRGLVHPDDVVAVKQRIRDLLVDRGVDEPIQFRMRHADGSWRVLEAVASTTIDDADLCGTVVTMRDITERKRAEQELAARVAQQAMLAELGRNALHDIDTRVLLKQAVEGVAATLGIEYGLALEWDVDADVLVPCAASGFVPDAVGLTLVPSGPTSQCGYTLAHGEAVVVQDLDEEDRFETVLRLAGLEVSSCLTVLIGGRDRPFGVFVTASRQPRRFSADDVHFVQSVANLLAVAVERRRTDEEIRHQALHDALTGLPNRTMLADRMSVALADIGRTGREVALLLMDLDRFKEINDTLGHDVGDRVLCEVARRLADVVRSTDTVARLGGDEFAVLCTHLAAEEATAVATKILGALGPPCLVDGMLLQVQGSIGLAFAPQHGTEGKTLLKRADTAMYRAKRNGSGLSVYSPKDDELRRLRVPAPHDGSAAFGPDELVLHYQPVVELATGRVVGVEALVRRQHPTRGLLLPDQFIPAAEREGLMDILTSWVLDHALSEARTWRDDGYAVPVSVNLSADVLHNGHFPGIVRAALDRAEVAPTLLELEITEAAVLADPSAALDAVTTLWALGVRLSLDDVGTGHPSATYLKHLPVAELKVDGAFVRRMATDEHDNRVVRSVIELAHDLALVVVAESVESAAVMQRLGDLRCDYAQGFHLAKPAGAEEFGRFLRAYDRAG